MEKEGVIRFLFGMIILAALVFGAFKLYLYLNPLLGNDILVTIKSENDHLFLSHGEKANVKFEIYASANPFCKAQCETTFIDLSKDEILDKKNFDMILPGQKDEEYELIAPDEGFGQKLYRLDASCSAIPTNLCHTLAVKKFRSAIVTLNYDLNDEEITAKSETQYKLTELINYNAKITNNLLKLEKANADLNQNVIFNLENSDKIKNEVTSLNIALDNVKKDWENGKYIDVKNSLGRLESDFNVLKADYISVNITVNSNVMQYNSMLTLANSLKDEISDFQGDKLENRSYTALTDGSGALIKLIQNRGKLTLSEFLSNVSEVNDKVALAKKLDNNASDGTLFNTNIPEITYSYVNLINDYSTNNITFKEVSYECCLKGKCDKCCSGDECKYDESKYPIILLHGHGFNKGVSAEYSLDSLGAIQENLENDEYINAGILLIGSFDENQKGVLGFYKNPVSFRASYYFDLFKDSNKIFFVQSNEDNIDTYAIRLRDIIDSTTYATNRDKVVIVTHSMGGLVVRRYVQLFGGDKIEHAVFIATPNHGISGDFLKYCSWIGASSECRDLGYDSLFINKLNRDELKINVTNIIGIGCDTGGENGDGIVTNSSAYLNGANNLYVNGKCEGSFDYFHNKIVDSWSYPETYRIIKEALNITN